MADTPTPKSKRLRKQRRMTELVKATAEDNTKKAHELAARLRKAGVPVCLGDELERKSAA
jgi:hypothetical protein